MYKRILVPLDGSEVSNSGLTEALQLAKSTSSGVRILHVVNELVLVGADASALYYADLIESLRTHEHRIRSSVIGEAETEQGKTRGLAGESAALGEDGL